MDYNPSDPSKLLGKGGYAEVYRGTFNGQSVAIKRVLQTSDSLWNERESNALAQLNHPNVVRLIHEEQNGDIHFTIRYYVLELCDASLDYYFLPDSNPKKYKRSIPFDKDAFIQMSEGLLYIHSKGLVHRDVKPGNVLISSNYGIALLKWSDFGLSRPVNERGTYTVSGIKGTIEWFAPEILVMMDEEEDSPNFNERRGTIKSDTFACGAVFFYLLSGGNHPYGKGISIASNIRDGKKVNMKALGKSWFAKDIILKMLDKDVNKRISLNDAIEGLKNTNYTIKEMFTEFKKLCRAAQLKTSKDTNELQLDRLRRLIDQKAFFDIPANEKKYIMETVCSIEKLHEPSREIVIKALVSSKGVKLDYINSLCSILTQRHLSENHLFKVAGLLLDAAIEMHHSWNEIRASEIFFDLYIYSFLNNDLLNKITKFLIDRGLDLNERDENGVNVLHYMCQYGRAFNLRNRLPLLLDLGIPIDAVDFKGRNALHCICSRGYFYSDESLLGKEEIQKEQSKRAEIVCDAIVCLVKHKININGRDHKGRTALFCLYDTNWFVTSNNTFKTKLFVTRVTRTLINLGLDVNATDKDGANVLHQVCGEYQRSNLTERIHILIDNGIKVNALDDKGWNALHYLCSRDEQFIKENQGTFIEAGVVLRENGVIDNIVIRDDIIKPESLCNHELFMYNLFCKLKLPLSSNALDELTLQLSSQLAKLSLQ